MPEQPKSPHNRPPMEIVRSAIPYVLVASTGLATIFTVHGKLNGEVTNLTLYHPDQSGQRTSLELELGRGTTELVSVSPLPTTPPELQLSIITMPGLNMTTSSLTLQDVQSGLTQVLNEDYYYYDLLNQRAVVALRRDGSETVTDIFIKHGDQEITQYSFNLDQLMLRHGHEVRSSYPRLILNYQPGSDEPDGVIVQYGTGQGISIDPDEVFHGFYYNFEYQLTLPIKTKAAEAEG